LADVQNNLKTNNVLAQYAPNPGVYHCPGDVRFNLMVGAYPAVGWAYDSYAATENVDPSGNDTDSFIKLSQIKRSADCMTFVEQADTRGYNEGNFVLEVNASNGNSIRFEDVFSVFHGNVGTFAFADGHAEGHKWRDPVIIAAGKASLISGSHVYDYQQYGTTPSSMASPDGPWIVQHCESPTNP
jgi:prepilin-type processing-associated H-X9-DG protein